jgi:hypothetical protein
VSTVKRTLAAAAGVALAVAGIPGSALADDTSQQRLTVVVVQDISQPQPTFSRVVARGVIDAVGTDVFRPSPEGDANSYSTYVFRRGTLAITTSPDRFDVVPDPVSCISRFTASGHWTVTGGTGAYRGAAGSGRLTATGVLRAQRTPQGCAQDRGISTGVVRATGRLALPSGTED